MVDPLQDWDSFSAASDCSGVIERDANWRQLEACWLELHQRVLT